MCIYVCVCVASVLRFLCWPNWQHTSKALQQPSQCLNAGGLLDCIVWFLMPAQLADWGGLGWLPLAYCFWFGLLYYHLYLFHCVFVVLRPAPLPLPSFMKWHWNSLVFLLLLPILFLFLFQFQSLWLPFTLSDVCMCVCVCLNALIYQIGRRPRFRFPSLARSSTWPADMAVVSRRWASEPFYSLKYL